MACSPLNYLKLNIFGEFTENILSLFLITGESVSNTFSVILGIYFSQFKPEEARRRLPLIYYSTIFCNGIKLNECGKTETHYFS